MKDVSNSLRTRYEGLDMDLKLNGPGIRIAPEDLMFALKAVWNLRDHRRVLLCFWNLSFGEWTKA